MSETLETVFKPSDDSVWKIIETDDALRVCFPDWEAIELSEKQFDILSSQAERKMINAGAGFGKDWIGIFEIISRAITLYNSRRNDPTFRRTGPLVNVAICAPTEPNYKETWDKLVEMVPQVPGLAMDGTRNYESITSKHKSITLFGKRGIRFNMITLFDPNNIRGQGWDIVLITEAAFMSLDTYKRIVLKRVNRGNYFGMIILISTPDGNWWDFACDQAIEKRGLFRDFQYFHATSFDNPTNVAKNMKAMLDERDDNPWLFDQERMAKLHIKAPKEGEGRFLIPGMMECSYYHERPTLTGETWAVFDLMYGGEDRLCRGIWDGPTQKLIDVRFWTAAELEMDAKNPYASIAKLFDQTNRLYPGCKIAYDCQGQQGGSVQAHCPGHLRLYPMRRSHDQKNAMVDDFLGRLANLDQNGRSIGIKFPHPECKWFTGLQQKQFGELYDEIFNYRRIIEQRKDKPYVYYTKGEGYGDDGMDMVSWACSKLPAMRVVPKTDTKALKRFLRS